MRFVLKPASSENYGSQVMAAEHVPAHGSGQMRLATFCVLSQP